MSRCNVSRKFRQSTVLDEELLDGILEVLDLRLELRALVGGDGAGDDGPGHAARATERLLGRYEHVRHVLVLGEEGQVEENLERLGVSREDDKLGDAAVEGLGGLVRALLQLLVVLWVVVGRRRGVVSGLVVFFRRLRWTLGQNRGNRIGGGRSGRDAPQPAGRCPGW